MSDSNITLAGRGHSGFVRGDYISITGTPAEVDSRRRINGRRRIISMTATTLTTRLSSDWRIVEWFQARAEDWILWPLSDLKARIRVLP